MALACSLIVDVCQDNACATVARMILAAPQALPYDHVLPVLFKFLPLRGDSV
jgi:hypothetical protein